MKDYLSVIRSARLFSGISEEELTPMLTCLKAEKKDFTKETFVLRTGDTADAIGLMLSGTVLIMQEDIWGNRNILSKAGPGQAFAAAYACEKLTHMGQRTTRAKIMSFLSAEAQRRRACEFEIPFSRQQFADYLGVERSGLSQELGRMKKEGLLDYHKSHFILRI